MEGWEVYPRPTGILLALITITCCWLLCREETWRSSWGYGCYKGYGAMSAGIFGCQDWDKRGHYQHLAGGGQGFCLTSQKAQDSPEQTVIQPRLPRAPRMRSQTFSMEERTDSLWSVPASSVTVRRPQASLLTKPLGLFESLGPTCQRGWKYFPLSND